MDTAWAAALSGTIGMQRVIDGGLLAAFVAEARRLGIGAGLAFAGDEASAGVERQFHRQLGGVQGVGAGVIQRLCATEIGDGIDRAGIELVGERVERVVAAPHQVAHTDLWQERAPWRLARASAACAWRSAGAQFRVLAQRVANRFIETYGTGGSGERREA